MVAESQNRHHQEDRDEAGREKKGHSPRQDRGGPKEESGSPSRGLHPPAQ